MLPYHNNLKTDMDILKNMCNNCFNYKNLWNELAYRQTSLS